MQGRRIKKPEQGIPFARHHPGPLTQGEGEAKSASGFSLSKCPSTALGCLEREEINRKSFPSSFFCRPDVNPRPGGEGRVMAIHRDCDFFNP
jgi:hypothetical protein